MSWLSNFVRPKIQALVRKPDIPEDLWTKCPSCEQMIFHRDLAQNLRVCPHCGHHLRMGAADRLALIFDDGQFVRETLPKVASDPLKFRDSRRYTDRLKDAQHKLGDKGAGDAILVAHGSLSGIDTVAAAFDFAFMGGSMGMAVGEGLVKAAEVAVERRAPLIVFPASGGARMQEGALSLMQMARTTVAVERVKEAGLPYIVVFTDPTTGGVTASFAMIGDIHISEPGALIGFAGQRVIQNTIREALPEGFQRAEYLLEHGMLDMVVPRAELKETLARTLRLLMQPVAPSKAEKKAEPAETGEAKAKKAEGAAPQKAESGSKAKTKAKTEAKSGS